MLSRNGVPRDVINKILIENPRRVLTLAEECTA